jgi:deazaflavin-dependent oxidoreductase (nitroreductase family)
VTGLAKSARPAGMTRWLLRAPIWLYRLNLGWVLGKRFLLLTHYGRNSGQWRQAVVEIVASDGDEAYYICSGWGEKSNWFQNVQKYPDVRIQVGMQRFKAIAARLPASEASAVLQRYAIRYPVAFQRLSKLMIGESVGATDEACRRLAEAVPVVRLKVVG